MFARSHLAGRAGIPRYGTEDERPLDAAEIRALGGGMRDVRVEFPVFEFFRIFDRQVLRYRWERPSAALAWLDRVVQRRLPRLRPYSFRVIVSLIK